MRIEFTNATGCPYGQFVVRADSDEDRVALSLFMNGQKNWRFWLHGVSYDQHPKGPRSFNFGWNKPREEATPAVQPVEDCFAARCALLVNKPKMRMLFLDDRTKRVESARRQFGGKFDLTIVSTVKECLRKLSSEEWDEVHLDHDLNGDDFQDPDSPTAGMEVVRYIVKCGWPPNKRKPIFRVHSSNIFASWLMVRTLHDVGLFAFWERFEYKDGDQCAS